MKGDEEPFEFDKEYELVKPSLFFACKYGVYPKNGTSSVCYVTDETRGKLICDALEYYLKNFDNQKIIDELMNKQNEGEKS